MSERKRLSLLALCACWESLRGELLDREGLQRAVDADWYVEHLTSMHKSLDSVSCSGGKNGRGVTLFSWHQNGPSGGTGEEAAWKAFARRVFL